MNGHIPFSGAGIEAGAGLNPPDSQFVFTNVADFMKAVTAGYGTDVATLTGGAALRLQSIEPSLLATIQEDKHFILFNRLQQSPAGATVDEWTVKPWIGGYPGSAYNSELGVMDERQGEYDRKVAKVKYLMTKRSVSVVQESQKTLVDTIAVEKIDAIRELKTSIEWGIVYGDSAVNPLEFDGLVKIITDKNDSDLIVDAAGGGLSYVAQEVINLSAAIASYGRFGKATDYFCSLAVQAAEVDQKIDPAFRVPVDRGAGAASYQLGTPVDGIRTGHGIVKSNQDVFIQEGQMPWTARPGQFPALVTAAALTAPTAVVAAAVAGPQTGSKWVASQAGNYYYAVESISKSGRSTPVKSLLIAVGATDAPTVTITNPADANVTGYAIYRSRKNGTNATSDFREMKRIPLTAGASTVFTDKNEDVPGTSPMLILNLMPGANAVTLRRLLPMTLFPLYPTNTATKPWSQLIFLYLRVALDNQVAMVKNILPASASWRPF